MTGKVGRITPNLSKVGRPAPENPYIYKYIGCVTPNKMKSSVKVSLHTGL